MYQTASDDCVWYSCEAQGEEMTPRIPILVWPFETSPPEYKALSKHGGDEDWLALVPIELTGRYIAWLDSGAVGDVSVHPLPDGRTVYIGAHA